MATSLTVVEDVVDLEGRVPVGQAAEVLEPPDGRAEGPTPGPAHQVHDGPACRRVNDIFTRIVDLQSVSRI